jgi:hypothetical protein
MLGVTSVLCQRQGPPWSGAKPVQAAQLWNSSCHLYNDKANDW